MPRDTPALLLNKTPPDNYDYNSQYSDLNMVMIPCKDSSPRQIDWLIVRCKVTRIRNHRINPDDGGSDSLRNVRL
jgi:hypothetical protein